MWNNKKNTLFFQIEANDKSHELQWGKADIIIALAHFIIETKLCQQTTIQ
jgi:hypothetical protein